MFEIIVKVVLDHSLVRGEVALSELVDVHIVVTTEKVVELLVVFCAVPLVAETSCEGECLACIPLHIGTEIHIILIHTALLDHIFRAGHAVCVDIVPVDIVESVPVQVCILRDVLLPCILSPGCLLGILPSIVRIIHPEIAWKVAVVVRTWVRCVIPVHRCISVLSCPPEHCSRSLKVVCRIYGILEDGHRLEGLADAGVAHPSVLVTPVAVVHVVAHQVINLLGGSVLRATLARSREGHEAEAMDVAELLLDTCIVCEIAVEHTLNPVVSAEAGRHVERI